MSSKGSYQTVEHDGKVKSINSNSVLVSILSESACSGCHAEKLCSLSGEKEKVVEVKGKFDVIQGESVRVVMEESMGYKALVLSYLVPLIIVITALVVMSSLHLPEWIAGLVSISALIPWFLILYLFRDRIGRIITFTLKT